jgi:hypothetical protein
MKYIALVTALLLLQSAAASAAERSKEWLHNVHIVGETYPDKPKVLKLLGKPDKVGNVVVSDPSHYAPLQPLYCAKPKSGTALQSWRYRIGQDSYVFYFQGDKMVCFASVFNG